nr:MAG TPA: hypothetical protein [Caudoviricetes sp.]
MRVPGAALGVGVVIERCTVSEGYVGIFHVLSRPCTHLSNTKKAPA